MTAVLHCGNKSSRNGCTKCKLASGNGKGEIMLLLCSFLKTFIDAFM